MASQAEMMLMILITFAAYVSASAAEDVELSQLQDQAISMPGHLKPLGSEATRLPVSELDEFPSPADFFENYVYPSVPVIIRQGAKRSPAFEKWSDEYLRSLPGAQEPVDVEVKKVEDRQTPSIKMPFSEFIDRYQTHDEYLVTVIPDFLK